MQLPCEDHKGLAATLERKVSKGQAEMTMSASHRDAARDRRERLQRLVGPAPRKGFRSRCPLGVFHSQSKAGRQPG